MNSNPFENWFIVNTGVTIPNHTPYAYKDTQGNFYFYSKGNSEDLVVCQADVYYTEYPLSSPPPEEPGSTILVNDSTVLTRSAEGNWVVFGGTDPDNISFGFGVWQRVAIHPEVHYI